MRLVLLPLLAVIALTGACSKSDADKLKHDSQAVGHDVATDVKKVGDDPNLKAAGSELKTPTQKAGDDLKKTGKDIGDHTRAAGDDAKDAAHDR
jgi:hypothetical protein